MIALALFAIAALLAGLWLIFSLLIIGHLIRYLGAEPSTWLVIMFYLLLSALVVTITLGLLSQIPFQDLLPYV